MFIRLALEKISVDKETFVDALKAEGLPVAMPNVIAANDSLFRMEIHENLGGHDVSCTLAALTRVEKAFLQ